MSRVIIGIHGLGNKPDTQTLKKWWKKSISEGLTFLDYSPLYFKFELVYWIDLLYDIPLDPDEKDVNSPSFLDSPWAPGNPDLYEPPSRLRQKGLDLLEKEMEALFLKTDFSLNFEKLTDNILKKYFYELNQYYSLTYNYSQNSVKLVRELIRDRLRTVLQKHKNKDILLIAHSMGTIIAYDVLANGHDKLSIHSLVTCGSPLGLPNVKGKIAAEKKHYGEFLTTLNTPETVKKNWFNLSDLRDKIALNYNLGDDYGPNSLGVHTVDKLVYNSYEFQDKKNPHSIYGYLRTPEMAEIIQNFLTQDRSALSLWILKQLGKIAEWVEQYLATRKINPQPVPLPVQEIQLVGITDSKQIDS